MKNFKDKIEMKIAKWCWRKLFHKYNRSITFYGKITKKGFACSKYHQYAASFEMYETGDAAIKIYMDGHEGGALAVKDLSTMTEGKTMLQYNF